MDRRGFFGALAGLSYAASSRAAARKRITLATYPGTGKADIPARTFMAGMAPLRQELEQAVGRNLAISLLRPISAYNAAATAGSKAPDFAYGPATSVALYMEAGYLPLVRVSEPASGLIVSKRPLRSIRSVAFPDPESWLAQVGEYTVEALLGRSLEYHYARSQNAAIESMRYGLADAAAVRPPLLRKLQATDPAYRAIALMPETPDFTLLSHPAVDIFTYVAIKDAWLGLSATAVASLDDVYHVKVGRFTHAGANEYDLLRRIVHAAKKFS